MQYTGKTSKRGKSRDMFGGKMNWEVFLSVRSFLYIKLWHNFRLFFGKFNKKGKAPRWVFLKHFEKYFLSELTLSKIDNNRPAPLTPELPISDLQQFFTIFLFYLIIGVVFWFIRQRFRYFQKFKANSKTKRFVTEYFPLNINDK